MEEGYRREDQNDLTWEGRNTLSMAAKEEERGQVPLSSGSLQNVEKTKKMYSPLYFQEGIQICLQLGINPVRSMVYLQPPEL